MGVYDREQGTVGLSEVRHRRDEAGNKAGMRCRSRPCNSARLSSASL